MPSFSSFTACIFAKFYAIDEILGLISPPRTSIFYSRSMSSSIFFSYIYCCGGPKKPRSLIFSSVSATFSSSWTIGALLEFALILLLSFSRFSFCGSCLFFWSAEA